MPEIPTPDFRARDWLEDLVLGVVLAVLVVALLLVQTTPLWVYYIYGFEAAIVSGLSVLIAVVMG